MDFNQRRVKGEDRRSTTVMVKSREVLRLGGKGKGMGWMRCYSFFFFYHYFIFLWHGFGKKILLIKCATQEWYCHLEWSVYQCSFKISVIFDRLKREIGIRWSHCINANQKSLKINAFKFQEPLCFTFGSFQCIGDYLIHWVYN